MLKRTASPATNTGADRQRRRTIPGRSSGWGSPSYSPTNPWSPSRYSPEVGPPPCLRGGSLAQSGIISSDDPYLWHPPDSDESDDAEGTYDAPRLPVRCSNVPSGRCCGYSSFSCLGGPSSASGGRGGVASGWYCGDGPLAHWHGDPGWGDQPSFFPPGVNCWTATAAQRAAEKVARRAHLAEQAPLCDAVLRYEARGRERDRAIQCHVKVAQACCGPLPPPQGAIRGWGIAGARSSLPSSTSTGVPLRVVVVLQAVPP